MAAARGTQQVQVVICKIEKISIKIFPPICLVTHSAEKTGNREVEIWPDSGDSLGPGEF